MPKGHPLTPQQHADIERLYPTMTGQEVADRIGCSRDAVARHVQRHHICHTPEFEKELRAHQTSFLYKASLLNSNRCKVAVISCLRAILRADRQNELDMPPSRRITELLIAITDLIHDLETLKTKNE